MTNSYYTVIDSMITIIVCTVLYSTKSNATKIANMPTVYPRSYCLINNIFLLFLFRYSCLQYRDLMKMPVKALAARHALVIVWTTNHPKHTEFVKNTLFPHWSIDYISEWHWMKVSDRKRL